MLLPDFYTLQHREVIANQINARILLHAEHPIFKGHFPNNPVTPGVCMLQVFKELAEEVVQRPMKIQSCKNIKFTALINPFVHPELAIEITLTPNGETYKISGSASFADTQALKIQALLTD